MRCQQSIPAAIALLILAGPLSEAKAQSEQEDQISTLLSVDRRFWQAYNACDAATFGQFVTDDVEFYHDKGGITFGAEALIASMQAGPCADGPRLRREVVDGSVHVFSLRKGNAVYGAVFSGQHRFYVVEKGKAERLESLAQFTHLWIVEDGNWRMSRILSYDHGPAPYVSTRTSIALPDSVLDSFVGAYRAPQGGTMNIRRENGALILSVGNLGPLTLYPESDGLFFAKERDLTFEFVRSDDGRVAAMRVRERGAVVDEAVPTK